jgi:hypothetical protein
MEKTFKSIQYQKGWLFVDEQGVGYTYNKPTYNSDGKVGLPENRESKAIIAQSPELSIPDIPYVELEEDVEQLAKQEFNHNCEGDTQCIWCIEDRKLQNSFIKGYKAAQAKKYSEKHLLGFLNYYNSTALLSANSTGENHGLSKQEILEKYIQSLKPKIESIELEMRDCEITCNNSDCKIKGCINPIHGDIAVTYQKDGRIFLKVKSIQYEK